MRHVFSTSCMFPICRMACTKPGRILHRAVCHVRVVSGPDNQANKRQIRAVFFTSHHTRNSILTTITTGRDGRTSAPFLDLGFGTDEWYVYQEPTDTHGPALLEEKQPTKNVRGATGTSSMRTGKINQRHELCDRPFGLTALFSPSPQKIAASDKKSDMSPPLGVLPVNKRQ